MAMAPRSRMGDRTTPVTFHITWYIFWWHSIAMDFQWTSMDNGPWINHPPGGPFLSFCKSQFFCEIRILSGTRVGSNYCPWTNQSLKWSRTFLNNWNWCTVMMSYNITIHKHNKKKQPSFDKKHLQQPNPTNSHPCGPYAGSLGSCKKWIICWLASGNSRKISSWHVWFFNPPAEDAPCFHMRNSEAWEFCWGKHLK